jgi:hypothetical protein
MEKVAKPLPCQSRIQAWLTNRKRSFQQHDEPDGKLKLSSDSNNDVLQSGSAETLESSFSTHDENPNITDIHSAKATQKNTNVPTTHIVSISRNATEFYMLQTKSQNSDYVFILLPTV